MLSVLYVLNSNIYQNTCYTSGSSIHHGCTFIIWIQHMITGIHHGLHLDDVTSPALAFLSCANGIAELPLAICGVREAFENGWCVQ